MAEIRIVPIRKIKIGSRVLCDIYNKNGSIMLKRGNIMTEAIMDKLESVGVNRVLVEAGTVELTDDEPKRPLSYNDGLPTDNIAQYREDFLLKKEFEQGKNALLDKDIDGAQDVAKGIAGKIQTSNSIKKELYRGRYHPQLKYSRTCRCHRYRERLCLKGYRRTCYRRYAARYRKALYRSRDIEQKGTSDR